MESYSSVMSVVRRRWRCATTTFLPSFELEQAQELTQLGRSQLYEQTRRWRETGGKEGIPVVEFGRCLRIPTAALLRMALIHPDATAGDSDAA